MCVCVCARASEGVCVWVLAKFKCVGVFIRCVRERVYERVCVGCVSVCVECARAFVCMHTQAAAAAAQYRYSLSRCQLGHPLAARRPRACPVCAGQGDWQLQHMPRL